MEGRVALVTGAAGDLGRAAALRLAADGAVVVACDLDSAADGLGQTVELCRTVVMDRAGATSPRPALSMPFQAAFDVTDPEAVEAAIERVVAEVGPPDAVFNNAGYQGLFAGTADYDPADFARVLQINVSGAFHVLRACARAMIAADRPGAIVNTASMAKNGPPNMVAYGASKAAVVAMTATAAKDLAPNGIRVNSVSPAFIGPGRMWDRQVELQAATPSQYYGDDPETVAAEMIGQVPLRRYGTLDEVAGVVAFLLSDEASYLTGIDIEIAGGAT
jgi:NAD(P)-dependent dehydrogenase (short-subunit alcohol dehydrogenase family)